MKCETCGKDPKSRNNWGGECSHVDCPHRRKLTESHVKPYYLRHDEDIVDHADKKLTERKKQ